MTAMSLQQAIALLEYKGPIDLDVRNCPFSEAVRKVDRFKKDMEKAYRRVARKHHPDVGGSAETMKQINNVIEAIRKMSVVRRPVCPVRVFTYSTSTSSTTGTWTTW